jgi:hypothetical protein
MYEDNTDIALSRSILLRAGLALHVLTYQVLDIVDIKHPPSLEYAKNLSKVISKLSPLIGNMIEFSVVELLNELSWEEPGIWVRQDPGFPDTLFRSELVIPNPGIEIKAWFPLATEITARFKDSVTMFSENNIDVALVAWLPEYIIWGKPRIIDTLVVSGKSVAEARDKHYHNPPEYIVFEPEDTSDRSVNLQQTNTNGFIFQEDISDITEARNLVASWGEEIKQYSSDRKYQEKMRYLHGRYVYRLDTNYAKIDRIEHPRIEKFKNDVLELYIEGKTIADWSRILSRSSNSELERALAEII